MKEFTREHRKYIFAFFVVLSLISVGIIAKLSQNKKPTGETKSNMEKPNYKSLTAGISTKGDAVSTLGAPISQGIEGKYSLLEFSSLVDTKPNTALFLDDKLALFKETINLNKTSTDILKTYGTTDKILYRSQVPGGYALYVYPNIGIAYLGPSGQSSIVSEIWYFEPTDLTSFKENFASNYFYTLPSSTENLPENFR